MNSATRCGIGVLGGMGPIATVDFMSKIIALAPASRDQEHVPLIVHQVPQIPDRSSAILSGSYAPLESMLAGLRRLARAEVEWVAIPCNSAHRWYDQLARLQELPVLHIAEAVRQELVLRELQGKRIALMPREGRISRAFTPAAWVPRSSRCCRSRMACKRWWMRRLQP